ncbi:hypothetical protein MAH1_02400 [Sessilibacter sp. MAH1]
MEDYSFIRISLFNGGADSFLAALDSENIPHNRVQCFSSQPKTSGIVESISALSEAMPWNTLAKVIASWIEARKSREVIITTESNTVIHAKGYSVSEIERLLKTTTNLAVIDTDSSDET